MRTFRFAALSAATAGILLAATACGADGGDDAAGLPDGPLVVAASPVPHAAILNFVKDNLAEEAGLELEVREFSDYVLPNTATEDGSVGANYFQHQPYLDDFQAEHGTHLVAVEPVHLEPLGLYSEKIDSLDALADGATVGIPNDATNGGRALNLLADNGLITLKDGAGITATEADIAENPKNLVFEPLEAAQIPRSLPDLDAAVINGNYAIEADLSPAEDAIVIEEAEGNPYANLLVVKEGNEDDPRVQTLAELLKSDEVKQFIEETYQGSVVAVD
ncbi:MetQ/NlpA family ABC transporter substrate-binding protein [Allostreptomyces psammosilenae]|uniref:Lipoprotein n=1 Tax=Allostreptomyces psammosilenae TaxID=1892865 RepID=A0A852ZRZ3_9ACTN|nr:D-methionine transport system substrate-binding protein [Allostreptomyces psammosilenae]